MKPAVGCTFPFTMLELPSHFTVVISQCYINEAQRRNFGLVPFTFQREISRLKKNEFLLFWYRSSVKSQWYSDWDWSGAQANISQKTLIYSECCCILNTIHLAIIISVTEDTSRSQWSTFQNVYWITRYFPPKRRDLFFSEVMNVSSYCAE